MNPKPPSDYDKKEYGRYLENLGLRANDKRSEFEKDRDRIIHSASFRRLQGKTQVFGLGGSDFFRTRLTHSLEVAQIGKGIALVVGHADTDLVEASCLAHDIGHPPFGHTGEDVLKKLMEDDGGFEANAQNLRILSRLEIRTAREDQQGINLTRATVDSLLKYKRKYSDIDTENTPRQKWKFYYDDDEPLVKWAVESSPSTEAHSFECEVMNWADDVAYSTHDLEDGIKAGLVSEAKIVNNPKIMDYVKRELGGKWDEGLWAEVVAAISEASRDTGVAQQMKGKRKDLIARLIDEFIHASTAKRRSGILKGIGSRYQYELSVRPEKVTKCEMLKKLVWALIIDDEHVATLARRADVVVNSLFQEFTEFGPERRTREMFPLDFRERLDKAKDESEKKRVACDFIAGMTDTYALAMYSRLEGAGLGSLLNIL